MFSYFGSDGFKLYDFNTVDGRLTESFTLDHDSLSKICVAEKEKIIALLDKEKVTIFNAETKSTLEICVANQSGIALSPCGHIAFTYSGYKAIPGQVQGEPNVHVFSTQDAKLLKSYIHRPSEGWQPQWISDGSLCAVRVDGEIHLYTDLKFDEKPSDRLAVKGARHFFLSPSPKRPHLAVYSPGEKGYPSIVRIYQCHEGKSQQITTKSFYRADAVQAIWNDKGTDVLVLTSTRSSNECYYGDQCLYYVTVSDSADNAVVSMPRKGSIYDVVWRPTGDTKKEDLFVVCYGDLPASVTVFGRDCEPRFDLGTAYCNCLLFNPHGTLLLLAGQGNLAGSISVWDFDKRKSLASYKIPDITSISWFRDGEHLLMATTTPRLRVNNGFGVWHYGGHKHFFQRTARRAVPRPASLGQPAALDNDLYEVRVLPEAVLPPPPILKAFNDATATQQKTPAVYVPPALRNRSGVAKQASAAMNMRSGPGGTQSTVKLPVGLDPNVLNANKPKKRKKPKASGEIPAASECSDPKPSTVPTQPVIPDQSVPSADAKKQMTRIRQKLNQIERLKAEQAAGKQLDHNQLDKVATETQLRNELERLTLNASC